MQAADIEPKYRRSARRFNLFFPVVLSDGDGQTRDISAEGIYFETDRQCLAGSTIHLAVLLPPESNANPFLWCEGQVIRVEPREPPRIGVGVAFKYIRFEQGRLSRAGQ